MNKLSHNRGALRESRLSGFVDNFSAKLPLFIYYYYLCFQIGAVLSCLTAFHNDKRVQTQSKISKYIASDKGDLQLQATNLAEGQNAQPVLSGDSPDQSILQNGKSYFVAHYLHIFSSWILRGVWTNMLVKTAKQGSAERDWYV